MNSIRRITQAVGVLLTHGYLAVLATGQIYKGPLKGTCLPVLGCYACPTAIFSCPIGSLQHFMAIGAVPLVLISGLFLIGLLLGRMTCGWLCPFGLLQDLLYKIKSPKFPVPRVLRQFKYLTLVALVLVIPYLSGAPWFSKLCPAGTLTAGIPWVLVNPHNLASGQEIIGPGDLGFFFVLKLAILMAFLAWFVVSKRPFCRTTCPLGAIFSLFNRVSLLRLRVSGTCRQCGQCRSLCPVDLEVSVEANSPECIRCLGCTVCKHVSVEMRLPAPSSGSQTALDQPGMEETCTRS